MHGYDFHEALYLNCEIMSLWVRGKGPRVGPTRPYSEHIFNFRNFLLLAQE